MSSKVGEGLVSVNSGRGEARAGCGQQSMLQEDAVSLEQTGLWPGGAACWSLTPCPSPGVVSCWSYPDIWLPRPSQLSMLAPSSLSKKCLPGAAALAARCHH